MSQKLKRFKTVRRAYQLFISKVQPISVVQEVHITERERVPTIWTVISAPPFKDEELRPVYQAQMEVLQATDRPLVDFDVVNPEEFPPDARDKILPSNAKLLWKRR